MADNDGWGNPTGEWNSQGVIKPNWSTAVSSDGWPTPEPIIGVDAWPVINNAVVTETLTIIPETYTVQVVKVGDLAVHNDILDTEDEEWIVTHIPTLTTFRRAVPEGKWSREQLIDWCVKVQSKLKDDWKQLARLNEKNYKDDAMKAVKERIQEHCLDTAVV